LLISIGTKSGIQVQRDTRLERGQQEEQ
jgi:hypothetical protein